MSQSTFSSLCATAGLALLILPLSSCMQNASTTQGQAYQAPAEPFPVFGRSLSFAVLSANGFSNTGESTIYGDIGVSNESNATGLDKITRTGGSNYIVDNTAAGAETDSSIAYINMQNAHCDHDLSGQNLGSMTLTPGVYCFSGDAKLKGVLTLDAGGDNRANFVFQVAGSLITEANATIQVINNGETCNVLWQVNESVTLASATNFVGGIIAQGNAIFDQGTKLNGKIMSRNGTVAINQTEIYNNFCPWW